MCLVFTQKNWADEVLPSWPEFIAGLRSEALSAGIRPEVFDQAFATVHEPSARVLRFDQTQPEKRLTFLEYRNTRVDPYRISLGRRAFQNHSETLTTIANQYHVNACFIVSIWGLETSYGRYKGNFPVVQSLATLAYNPRRSAFFRRELIIALHMLDEGDVSLSDLKGEWAGASGHCQFMPSTWLQYGVAYSGTRKADIWNNVDDALSSIANFLRKNGWHENEPWAIEVVLPPQFNSEDLGTKITKSVAEWQQMGVVSASGIMPAENLSASIIYPEGGPAYMVFNNFKTLLKWNRSNYYAMTLGYLAEEICERKL